MSHSLIRQYLFIRKRKKKRKKIFDVLSPYVRNVILAQVKGNHIVDGVSVSMSIKFVGGE